MIFVFRTSVKTKLHVRNLKPHMKKLLPDDRWNFDLEDCDKILRVECGENSIVKIVDLLNIHKFNCEELK